MQVLPPTAHLNVFNDPCTTHISPHLSPPSQDNSTTPKRLVLGSFLPLPTIIASPVCTPTPTFPPFQDTLLAPDNPCQVDKDPNVSIKITTPSNSCMSLHILFATPPTWISTPPTPPKRPLRKTLACDTRPPVITVSPSASFPASTSPHVTAFGPKGCLKRCLSYPMLAPGIHSSADSESDSELQAASKNKITSPLRHLRATFQLDNDSEEFTHSEDGNSIEENISPTNCESLSKEATRMLHVLRELLVTEMDYVRDLGILLTAYIQQLHSFEPRVSAFSRASVTFASGPWINSYSYSALQVGPSPAVGEGMPSSSSSNSIKPALTEREINIVSRNLKDILSIHEEFVRELQDVLSPLSISEGNTDLTRFEINDSSSLFSIVEAVSDVFVAEAARFNAYQTYCSGHSEALAIIRRLISQYPSDWEMFEQRCLRIASRMNREDGDKLTSETIEVQPNLLNIPSDKMNGSKRAGAIVPCSPGIAGPSMKGTDRCFDYRAKLALTDYMIKPVQRICKYPLLLEQLKPRRSTPEFQEFDVVIGAAIRAVRDVVGAVDEARRMQEAITKSSLIISRLVLPSTPASPSSCLSDVHIPTYTLSPSFISSLGPCILADSVDVLHYHPRQSFNDLMSVKAKYLGAFLYSGYLILVKILKGKKYEPRHWFPLSEFEAGDVADDEATLPYSFRLSSSGIRFDISVACEAEKAIWLQSIHESMSSKLTWKNEPLPSYGKDDPEELIKDTEMSIHSGPMGSDTELSEPSMRIYSHTRKSRREPSSVLAERSGSSIRRSSSVSVKSIFSPIGYDPDSILIRRSSASARLHVDQDFQDVASQSCLSARRYASLHDEELFPTPKQHAERSGFTRSASAISVAGMAKNRLSKQESLRIPRRKVRCDSLTTLKIGQETSDLSVPISSRRNGKTLSIQSLPTHPRDAAELSHPSSAFSTSTSVYSSSISITIPTPHSPGNSPLSRSASSSTSERYGSRSSLVRNVKDFFHIGSSSPPLVDGPVSETGSPLLRRWRRGSIRSKPHSLLQPRERNSIN